MTMIDDIGYLADRASVFDLGISSVECQQEGFPFVIGVEADPGTSTRESELRAWLEQIQPEDRAVLWLRGQQARLNIRGVLTDGEGIGSVLVNVFAIYNPLDDNAKVAAMKASVDHMSPGELLDLVEATV